MSKNTTTATAEVTTPATNSKQTASTTTSTTSPASEQTTSTTAPALSQLPAGYLANGYFDADGEPDVRYVTDLAKEIAKKLAPMDQRLFEEMYRRIMHIGFLPLTVQLLEINKLVPIAANLVKQGKAPVLLLDFCEANAATVKSVTDCAYFRNHMEAVCGFMN